MAWRLCHARGWHHSLKRRQNWRSLCEPEGICCLWVQSALSASKPLTRGALRSLQASSRTASFGNHRVCASLCAGSKEGRCKCKWGRLLWQRRQTTPNVWLVQVIISTFLCLSKCRIAAIRTNDYNKVYCLLFISFISNTNYGIQDIGKYYRRNVARLPEKQMNVSHRGI